MLCVKKGKNILIWIFSSLVMYKCTVLIFFIHPCNFRNQFLWNVWMIYCPTEHYSLSFG